MNARKARQTPNREPGLVSGWARGKGARLLRPAHFLLPVLLAAWNGLHAASPSQNLRVVQVTAAIDTGLETEEMAELRLARWMCGASHVFGTTFGLRFDLQRFVSWSPAPGRRPLPCLMMEFLAEVEAGDADLVIGLVSPDRSGSRSPGIASYADGALLLQDFDSDQLMTLVLVHELGHIFGAVDLSSGGSIMSATETRLDFDPFTSKIIMIHRSRAFGRAPRLLPDRDLYEALMTYRERAALGLGEVELGLVLARAYLEWDARGCPLPEEILGGAPCPALDCVGEAVRQCEKSLTFRPECPVAQHLMGVALERAGDLERAQVCFKKALDLSAGSTVRR